MSSKVIEFNPAVPPELSKDSDGNATTKGEAYTFDVPSIVTNPIKVTAPDGSYFSWQPAELCYKDENGQIDYIVGSSPSAISIFKNQAKYSRTFPLSDDIFNAEADRVKHWTILSEKPRNSAEYLTGKIVFGVSGLITGIALPPGIHESIQSGMFNLPKPIIKNLTGNEIEGYYEVIDTGNGQKLFIWFDADFLNNAVYPVTIDPTVIVSFTYWTSYTARPLFLSNGWIIVAVKNGATSVIFYVSKDKGSTWSELCYMSAYIQYYSMVSKGTIIYVVIALSAGYDLYVFDAASISDINIFNNSPWKKSEILGGISGSTYDCSIAISSFGTLSVAFACRRNDSDESINIWSVKSTDDGVTWTKQDGTVGRDQLTTINDLSYAFTIPYVIYDKNDSPIIFFQENHSSTYYVVKARFVNNAWNLAGSIYYVNGHSQDGIIGILQKYGANIGRIWIAWSSKDDTDNTYYNIRVSYSDDNGATWSTPMKITSGNTVDRKNPTLSEKPNGDFICMYEDNGSIVYQICANGGTTFTGPYTIGTGTKPSIMDYAVNGMAGFIYMGSNNVEFDKFLYNTAPNAPILMTKDNFDATKAQVLSWIPSDPDPGDTQSAYELVITKTSNNAVVEDTGKVVNTSSLYNLAANTLLNGTEYQWKVKTWDSSDAEGPYSSLETFTCAVAPTATITNPSSDGSTITASKITAGWNFNDSESGRTQSKYQVRLADSNDNELWNSGQVSDANARALTCDYVLANNTSYKLKITVWNDLGIQSDESVRTFTVSFTPPAVPTISSIADNDICAVIINITNPAPSGSEPIVSGNDIYRDGIRIASNVNGQYVDYAVEPFTQHTYKAVALGDNGTVSESPAVKASASITDVQLMLISDPTRYVKLKYNPSKEEKAGPTGELMQFAGRKLPVAEFDNSDNQNINCSFTILDKPDLDMLLQLADSKQTLLYRDSRGRKIYCTINDGISTKDELPAYWTVSFTINAISYDEEV
jgi:hypothetical protein